MKDYQPIACALHEQYQFAVMKRAWLELDWVDGMGGHKVERLLPKDVITHSGAEYLMVENRAGVSFEIRLDWIKRAAWVEGRMPILA